MMRRQTTLAECMSSAAVRIKTAARMDTKDIIRKWYALLEIPKKYDSAFSEALSTIDIPKETDIESYDLNDPDGAKNFLSFLYMCERTEQLYEEKGIGRKVLIDTLKDIRIILETYRRIGKELYLGELWWLKRHLTLELFKLGRLQFSFGSSVYDSEKYSLKTGDPVIEVHIDETAPIDPASCEASYEMADEFFRKYFREKDGLPYTCESWLLDEGVLKFVSKDSNIARFQKNFDVIGKKPSDSILQYVFKWDTTRENVINEMPRNDLSEAVKKEAINGTVFYEGYGIRLK